MKIKNKAVILLCLMGINSYGLYPNKKLVMGGAATSVLGLIVAAAGAGLLSKKSARKNYLRFKSVNKKTRSYIAGQYLAALGGILTLGGLGGVGAGLFLQSGSNAPSGKSSDTVAFSGAGDTVGDKVVPGAGTLRPVAASRLASGTGPAVNGAEVTAGANTSSGGAQPTAENSGAAHASPVTLSSGADGTVGGSVRTGTDKPGPVMTSRLASGTGQAAGGAEVTAGANTSSGSTQLTAASNGAVQASPVTSSSGADGTVGDNVEQGADKPGPIEASASASGSGQAVGGAEVTAGASTSSSSTQPTAASSPVASSGAGDTVVTPGTGKPGPVAASALASGSGPAVGGAEVSAGAGASSGGAKPKTEGSRAGDASVSPELGASSPTADTQASGLNTCYAASASASGSGPAVGGAEVTAGASPSRMCVVPSTVSKSNTLTIRGKDNTDALYDTLTDIPKEDAMQQTCTILPLVRLMVELIRSCRRNLSYSTGSQLAFKRLFLNFDSPAQVMRAYGLSNSMDWLKAKSDTKVEPINKFLEDNNISLRMEESLDQNAVYAAAIMRIARRWKNPGTESRMTIPGVHGKPDREVPSISFCRGGVDLFNLQQKEVFRVKVASEDGWSNTDFNVFMMQISEKELESLYGFNHYRLAVRFNKQLSSRNPDKSHISFEVPMVEVEETMKQVPWLSGIRLDGKELKLAQYAVFRMNEAGFEATAAVTGASTVHANREIETYKINGPFLVWITHSNSDLPCMTVVVGRDDFKKPFELGERLLHNNSGVLDSSDEATQPHSVNPHGAPPRMSVVGVQASSFAAMADSCLPRPRR